MVLVKFDFRLAILAENDPVLVHFGICADFLAAAVAMEGYFAAGDQGKGQNSGDQYENELFHMMNSFLQKNFSVKIIQHIGT